MFKIIICTIVCVTVAVIAKACIEQLIDFSNTLEDINLVSIVSK